MRLMVLLGSVRQNRRGEKIARWVADNAAKDSRFEVELVDVKELGLPFYDEPAGGPYGMAATGGNYTNPKGKAWAEKVATFEGIVIVSAEYNHGYPASLKNALDWVGPEWKGKPVGFVTYGWSGGIRATEQLRQVVVELGLNQVRTAVSLAIRSELGEEGSPNQEHSLKSLQQMFGEITELKK